MVQLFTDLFGPSFGPTMAYLSLLLIVVAIALAAWFAFSAFSRPRLASGKRSRQTRLAITDVAMVDKHRRLVLLRRDEVEHLIMIGGHSDLVIESDIRRNVPARPRAAQENKAGKSTPIQKTAEIPKQSPPPAKAAATAPPTPKSNPQSQTQPAKLPPLMLQEEIPKPLAPAAGLAPKPPLPAPSMAATAPKLGAVSGALAGATSTAASAFSDAAKTAKTGLAMPAEAKPVTKDEKTAAESDPAAMKEMNTLLEELAVPKK